jgi:predicted ATPase/DNA-binding SARP family transcriptional activator
VLYVKVIGPFEARIDGEIVRPLRTRRGEWLLALLAFHAGREQDRTWLAATLWPDSQEAQALGNLRRTLTDLRDALGDSDAILAPTARSLALDPNHASSDYQEIRHAVATRDPALVEAVVGGCAGELFGNCFEEWPLPFRAEWHHLRGQLLSLAIDHATASGDVAALIRSLRLAVHADPYREHFAAELMRALASQGDFAAAVDVYRTLRQRLSRDLAMEPAKGTQNLYEEIRIQARVPATTEVSAHEKSISLPSLPNLGAEIYGRDALLGEVDALLTNQRLVTLCGPGGIGKTRVAVEVASRRSSHQAVLFCDLTAISVAEVVAAELHRTLGVPDRARADMSSALAERWGEQPLLLVVDNCEHVVDAAAIEIATMLHALPSLRVLTTSREPLRLPDESIVIVEPLAAEGDQSPAQRLFNARTRRVRKGWEPSAEQASMIEDICLKLDCLPLAIEFAAGQMQSLSLSEIHAGIQSSVFPVMTVRGGVNERQRTLVSTLDWSYTRLAPGEQAALRVAATFVGAFRMADIIGVSEQIGRNHAVHAVDVAGLVERSLILREEVEDQSVYRLLETTREYARQHVTSSEEGKLLRAAHAQHFIDWVRETVSHESPDGMRHAFTEVERQYENIRAALGFVILECKDAEQGLDLQLLLHQFWSARTRIEEAWYWSQEITKIAPPKSFVASRIRMVASLMEIFRGHREDGLRLALEANEIAAEVGDAELAYLGKIRLVTAYQENEDYPSAEALVPSILEGVEGQPSDVQLDVYVKLGILSLHVGKYEDSLRFNRRSYEISKRRGELRKAAWSRINEADTLQFLERYAEAEELYSESLKIMSSCQDRMGTLESARSLSQVRGFLATTRDARRTAIRHVGAVQSNRADLPWFTRADEELFLKWRGAMVAEVGEDQFKTDWTAGCDASMQDAIHELLT